MRSVAPATQAEIARKVHLRLIDEFGFAPQKLELDTWHTYHLYAALLGTRDGKAFGINGTVPILSYISELRT